MSDDWDLFAVVRSCSSSSSAATAATSSSYDNFLVLPDPFEPKRGGEEEDLRDLFKPFFPNLKPLVTISPLSVLGQVKDPSPPEMTAEAAVPLPPQPVKRHPVTSSGGAAAGAAPRSKRRKVQMKRVCEVAAEDLSCDNTWSWRKYGQKPIKGSPYPRGYYKCSTSKGCLARKQVERNRSDPGMFVVTYTGDHNHPMPTHRNSLAGVTRLKTDGSTTTATADPNKPSCSPPATTTDKMEDGEEKEDFPEVDEEEDEFGGADMAVGDDFFEGLEEFTGSRDLDCASDHFPTSFPGNKSGGGG